MKQIKVHLIWYTEGSGRRYLVDITDNLEKWLEYNNSLRDEEAYEKLSDFEIQEKYLLMFNKIEEDE